MARQLYGGNDYRRALNIEELRAIARRRVPHFAFEYVDGGAEDEVTLRWNRAVFDTLRLVPATLVDTTGRDQCISLFGKESASPLIIAPTGLNGMLRHRADVALARAAAAAGIPFTLSTVSNVRLEEVAAEAGGRLWLQLYVVEHVDMVGRLIERADQAGCEALVFTTDANVFGHREWDKRSYYAPGKLTLSSKLDVLRHLRWLFDVALPHGIPRFENIIEFLPPEAQSASAGVTVIPKLFRASITWDDVARLRDKWPRKLIVKGILSAADAERAAALGVDGIVLSNHGGRQLETCVSAMEVLPDIARALGDRLTLIVDGGFRRGTDVVKAMALGAHAVMVGRPVLYGVTAGGEAGASHALKLLSSEIDRVLGQLGCRSWKDVGRHLLVQDGPGPLRF